MYEELRAQARQAAEELVQASGIKAGQILVVGCSSRGYAMLKDVPDDIKQILGDAVKAAVQDPDLIEQLNAIYTTTDYKEGQEYVDYMNQQQQQARETWGV